MRDSTLGTTRPVQAWRFVLVSLALLAFATTYETVGFRTIQSAGPFSPPTALAGVADPCAKTWRCGMNREREDRERRKDRALEEWLGRLGDEDDKPAGEVITELAERFDLTEEEVREVVTNWSSRHPDSAKGN